MSDHKVEPDIAGNTDGVAQGSPTSAPPPVATITGNKAHLSQEQLARYMTWVVGEMNRFDRSGQRNELLWHYTTGQGALDIIVSGTLWATQVSCLNDSTELTHAAAVLRQAMVDLVDDPSAPDGQRELIQKRLQQPYQPETAPIYPFFVACFSEDGDDLSQWRAYCGGEGGVALGFHPQDLVQRAPENRILLPVEYRKTVQEEEARRILDAIWEAYQRDVPLQTDDRSEWEDAFFGAWGQGLNYLAPIFKNEAFQSEKEWRIIKEVKLNDFDELRQLKFRQRASMITRHFPLALGGNIFPLPRLPLREVRIGPARHKSISEQSMKLFLYTQGYDITNLPVTSSSAPFQAH